LQTVRKSGRHEDYAYSTIILWVAKDKLEHFFQ
jgi:hypothetical protein